MKQHSVFSPAEAVKSLMIFILIVVMLVLLVLLMIGQNGTREEALPLADRMVVYASGAQPMFAAGMDTARVAPQLLAYRRGGGAFRILYASDALGKPYERLYPLLRDLFGSRAVGYAADAAVGGELLAACAQMEDCIYIRYHGALPVSVIRAYTYSAEDSETTAAVLDERTGGEASYLHELYLIPLQSLRPWADVLPMALSNDTDAVCALTCDDGGAVTLYCMSGTAQMPGSSAPAEELTEDTGLDDSAGIALFSTDAQEMAEEKTGVLDLYLDSMETLTSDAQTGTLIPYGTATAASLDGIYRMPQIMLTPYDPAAALYGDAETLSAVLGLLGMRERDKDSYYTDGSGTRIYLNASGRLTVSGTASAFYYDALQEGGLDLAEYLGYASIGGDYLLSEYLRASDRLLSLLETEESAFGGDALVCSLLDVRMASDAEEETLVLTYGYTYRGIPLLDETGEIRRAMVLKAGGGIISHLELYPCHAEISEKEQYLLPQTTALKAMALEQPSGGGQTDGQGIGPLSMAYLCCDAADAYGVHTADWIGLLPRRSAGK
ncbi:MAG: hypothetical protein E7604_01460 [Ruminococcaceae bacterium]|nr:hypothetical protein [Oscillospiraceae bacterium]